MSLDVISYGEAKKAKAIANRGQKPLRNVFARGRLSDQRYSGSETIQTSRVRCVLRSSAVMVRFVYANWYLPSGNAEQPMGNDISVKASVENPASATGSSGGTQLIPITFSGKRTVTIENNCQVVSDPVLVNVPADWAFYVRSCVTVATGGKFPTQFATTTTNSAQQDTSGVSEGYVYGTDSSDSGTINATTGFVFGPVGILIEDNKGTASVLTLGDSHMRGTGIVTARSSGILQALINAGVPMMSGAVGGDSYQYSKATINCFRRMGWARFNTRALFALGTNDIWAGYTLAELKASAIAYWKIAYNQGLAVDVATVLPRPGASTDGYLTVANQSIVNPTYEAVRTGYNTWLRSGQAATDFAAAGGVLSSVVDQAALIEVNSANVLTLNGGFWKAPAAGSVTQTGTATGVTAGTTSTITDTSKAWATNQFQNQVVLIASATTGALQFGRVASNTATVLTIASSTAWTLPTGTVTYQIQPALCWDDVHPTEPGHVLISAGLDLSYMKAA